MLKRFLGEDVAEMSVEGLFITVANNEREMESHKHKANQN